MDLASTREPPSHMEFPLENNKNNFNWPVSIAVKDIAVGSGGLGLDSWARHQCRLRYDVSSELCCAGVKSRR